MRAKIRTHHGSWIKNTRTRRRRSSQTNKRCTCVSDRCSGTRRLLILIPFEKFVEHNKCIRWNKRRIPSRGRWGKVGLNSYSKARRTTMQCITPVNLVTWLATMFTLMSCITLFNLVTATMFTLRTPFSLFARTSPVITMRYQRRRIINKSRCISVGLFWYTQKSIAGWS